MTLRDHTIYFTGEYINLGQLLKFLNLVYTGGEEKSFLAEHNVLVDGEKEERRGRKLRPGSRVEIDGELYFLCELKN